MKVDNAANLKGHGVLAGAGWKLLRMQEMQPLSAALKHALQPVAPPQPLLLHMHSQGRGASLHPGQKQVAGSSTHL